ncbi:MAG: hypothetical protein AAF761_05135 [Pseudomonadota bacterium]
MGWAITFYLAGAGLLGGTGLAIWSDSTGWRAAGLLAAGLALGVLGLVAGAGTVALVLGIVHGGIAAAGVVWAEARLDEGAPKPPGTGLALGLTVGLGFMVVLSFALGERSASVASLAGHSTTQAMFLLSLGALFLIICAIAAFALWRPEDGPKASAAAPLWGPVRKRDKRRPGG